MGELLQPVPDDDSDLRELWERDYRGGTFDADEFRAELLEEAAFDEAAYAPFDRAMSRIRQRGTEALAAHPTGAALPTADLLEGTGWFALAEQNPGTASALMEQLLFTVAPRLPRHWLAPDLEYAHSMLHPVYGNTPEEAQLTRLAILALRPQSRQKALHAVRQSVPRGDDPFSSSPSFSTGGCTLAQVPEGIAGLVALAEASRGPSADNLDPLVQSIVKLHQLIMQASSSKDRLRGRALRQQLLEFGRREPGAAVAAAEWFLALESSPHDEALTAFALENPELLDHVQSIAASDSPVADRAEGFVLAIRDGDLPTLTSTVMWWADTRLYAAPTPIASPTSTWLNDAALEAEIRARIDGAIERLLEKGLSEETEVTGALVQQLVNAFNSSALLPQSTSTVPFTLEVTSTNSKTNEKVTGADLGIVLDSRVGDSVHLIIGHLVQVKQATNRESTAPPTWQIKRTQLENLLDTDPTATYWLIQQHHNPKVIAVPARLLAGIMQARGERETTTVGWADVRSASASLGQVLLDLFIGLWIGTLGAVDAASGLDSRHEGVKVLTARIRSGG